jgi:hypothetical protein
LVGNIFEDIGVAAQRYTGLSRKAIDYGLFQKRLFDRAKGPDYSPSEWEGLRDFVSDDFRRVGNFKEVMTIDTMIAFLSTWCVDSHWEGSFKRVTEYDNVVLLELEERVVHNGEQNVVNSVSVYEFNPEGKLRHLDIYLQQTPVGGMPSAAYE